MGLAIGGQMGGSGWGEQFGWVLPFSGVAMVLFITIALGIFHRCMLIREVNSRMAQFGRVDLAGVAASVLPIVIVEMLVFTPAFGVCFYLSTTDGVRAYTLIAMFGFPLELIALSCLDLAAVTFVTSHVPEREAAQKQKKAAAAYVNPESHSYGDLLDAPSASTSLLGTGGISGKGNAEIMDLCGMSARFLALPMWIQRWPTLARVLVMIVGIAGMGACAGVAVSRLVDGWAPTTTSASLLPQTSYSHDYFTAYDRFFAAEATVPLDFPIVGVDFGNPANGPGLMAAAATLKSSPLLNASEFRDWYGAFIEYCSSSTSGFLACAPSMVNGYPTNASLNRHILLFIADKKYQVCDFMCVYRCFSTCLPAP